MLVFNKNLAEPDSILRKILVELILASSTD